MTKFSRLATACLMSAGTVFAAAQANAATLGVLTHEYGTNPGHVDPTGNDLLGADFVTVSDQSGIRFSDAFDLSSFAGNTITGFDLGLEFNGAGPVLSFTAGEFWTVRIQGSDAADTVEDLFGLLNDNASPQLFAVNAGTDSGTIDAFAQSIASGSLAFWFSEFTGGSDDFNLASATLTVYGDIPVAAVPLPASMPLLLVGLGGFGIMRQRRKAS